MRCVSTFLLTLLFLATAGASAVACMTRARLDLADVRYAAVVVVGRISQYEHVLDPEPRKRREEMMKNASEPAKALFSKQTSFLSDYVRFRVSVDEVLAGSASQEFLVTWDNSTFGEPEMIKPGSYLIAVRRPGADSPPLRGPSATIMPSPEPDTMTVLQAPCAPAFLFPSDSQEADDIRALLSNGQKQ